MYKGLSGPFFLLILLLLKGCCKDWSYNYSIKFMKVGETALGMNLGSFPVRTNLDSNWIPPETWLKPPEASEKAR